MKNIHPKELYENIDIRIGLIKGAYKIPEANKLLVLLVDVGEQQARQIVCGIGELYPDPVYLVGLSVLVLCNIEPKIIAKKYTTEGMLLACYKGEDYNKAELLTIDSRRVGDRIY